MIIAFNWRTFWVKSLSQEVLSPYLTISVFLFPFFLIFSWIILYYFVFSPLLIHLSHLTHSFSILFHLALGPRKVNFMDDIKELPCFLISGWLCSMEDTSKRLKSGKNMKLRYLFSFSPVRWHGSSPAMQSTTCVSVTWPLYVTLWEFQAQRTAQMLILWLLLLLWMTNSPLSLTQEFCVFCQHPWNYSRIICQLASWAKSQTILDTVEFCTISFCYILFFV